MSNRPRITDYPEPITQQSDVASLFKKGYQNRLFLSLPHPNFLTEHITPFAFASYCAPEPRFTSMGPKRFIKKLLLLIPNNYNQISN
ncbi:MAG: hypothetical protein F6J98_26385 [Moorea sp. SIO4G2]|uniref:hypothetical protein n=1 Tax=unclassified Moorena TaxID=2683338 RepID=UPI0013CC5DC6|nr:MULTISPECIES: hypothetical protein [unclassified Moorena]NEO24419.1 hypothetical protein [Moorena sp. SIO4A5]NEO63764.1 hypothetical protein [Moorena sp. SIO4G2]